MYKQTNSGKIDLLCSTYRYPISKPRTSLIVPFYYICEEFENKEFNGLGKCVKVANPDMNELKQDYGLTTCFVFCALLKFLYKFFQKRFR